MDQISTIDERTPLISIIIPTYNRAGLIRETLDSIKAQTSRQWECIVVDDMSSDNTETIVAEYSKADNRFSFYQRDREPKGAPTCRNIGLQHAKGDWVIFLDSDDLLHPDLVHYVKKQIHKDNKKYDVIITRTNGFANDINESYKLFTPDLVEDDLKSYLVGGIVWQTAGAIWRKDFVLGIGGFCEGLIKGQDWEIAVKALLRRPCIFKTPFVGTYHRMSFHERIGATPVTLELHEQLFECCIFLISTARENKQAFASKSLCASALYRLGCIIWATNSLPSKKLISRLSYVINFNYIYSISLLPRIYTVYMLKIVQLKIQNFSERVLGIDGYARKIT